MLLLLPSTAAFAGAPRAVTLTAQDAQELNRVTAYLNGIRTMTARFRQLAGNGAVSTGSLWVARPGRMRFEYDPPSPITLIADWFYVIYWDKQLQEASKVGLKSTPAWFLLRDPISFGQDITVTRFERAGNNLRITVVESAEPDTGSLTIDFTENPLSLRQWTVVDRQERMTTVSLSQVQFGMVLDPKLFQYHDPYERSRSESSN